MKTVHSAFTLATTYKDKDVLTNPPSPSKTTKLAKNWDLVKKETRVCCITPSQTCYYTWAGGIPVIELDLSLRSSPNLWFNKLAMPDYNNLIWFYYCFPHSFHAGPQHGGSEIRSQTRVCDAFVP